MKRPLGRGLENLMPTDDSGDPASDLTRSSASGAASPPRTGVDRLIGGGEQLELGARSGPRNAFSAPSQPSEFASDFAPARVPAWIYYLADLVLVSAVVWLIVLSSGPMSQREVFLCLGLSVLAAVLGSWPWLRNVLFCSEIGEAKNLPAWIFAEDVDFGGDLKCLVIHLKKPYVAVEVTETSWNGLNAKPYWIDGPPNLPPGGARQLLDDAIVFFKEHQQAREAVSTSRPLESGGAASDVPSGQSRQGSPGAGGIDSTASTDDPG